jgi:hypothetical protein
MAMTCEIEQYVRGRGAIGEYLANIFQGFQRFYWIPEDALSFVLWDMANIGYLVNPEWVPTVIMPAPTLELTEGWTPWTDEEEDQHLKWVEGDSQRHICRTAINLQRDFIFHDFYTKLEKHSSDS